MEFVGFTLRAHKNNALINQVDTVMLTAIDMQGSGAENLDTMLIRVASEDLTVTCH